MKSMAQGGKTVTILVVDDDDIDAKSIERAFRGADIENPIERAVSGVDALALLRGEQGKEKLPKPYLMLVDLNMPRMNGLELIKEVRNDPEFKDTVIFVLTTSKTPEDMSKAYDLSIAGYVVKETVGHEFIKLVEMIDCYWRVISLSKQA
ncbi:MAG: response regulator [Rickettsiales bacterium]|nr:response regulator [Rickettsiales bacterium]